MNFQIDIDRRLYEDYSYNDYCTKKMNLFQGIKLKFGFPFYGHTINRILIATGGNYLSVFHCLSILYHSFYFKSN